MSISRGVVFSYSFSIYCAAYHGIWCSVSNKNCLWLLLHNTLFLIFTKKPQNVKGMTSSRQEQNINTFYCSILKSIVLDILKNNMILFITKYSLKIKLCVLKLISISMDLSTRFVGLSKIGESKIVPSKLIKSSYINGVNSDKFVSMFSNIAI